MRANPIDDSHNVRALHCVIKDAAQCVARILDITYCEFGCACQDSLQKISGGKCSSVVPDNDGVGWRSDF